MLHSGNCMHNVKDMDNGKSRNLEDLEEEGWRRLWRGGTQALVVGRDGGNGGKTCCFGWGPSPGG